MNKTIVEEEFKDGKLVKRVTTIMEDDKSELAPAIPNSDRFYPAPWKYEPPTWNPNQITCVDDGKKYYTYNETARLG